LGFYNIIKLLLDRDAVIEVKDTDNWTALYDAADSGNLEMIKLLLDRGAEIEAKDTDNWTALHGAADRGYLEVIKLLLGRGLRLRKTISITEQHFMVQHSVII
jgi:ankyrin repeat protein